MTTENRLILIYKPTLDAVEIAKQKDSRWYTTSTINLADRITELLATATTQGETTLTDLNQFALALDDGTDNADVLDGLTSEWDFDETETPTKITLP